MHTVSIKYSCKYCLDFAPHYWWTICGKCVNTKTGRLVKSIRKGGSYGYTIQGNFYSLTRLRKSLVEIKKEVLPF